MAQTYFASIQPGLEQALLTEVRRLGGKRARVLTGGVEFDGARKTLYAAALGLRTATRIWQRIDEFRSRDAPELYRKTRRIDWERLLPRRVAIDVRATSSTSSLFHTDKIAETVAAALEDRLEARRDLPGTATQTLLVRLVDDRCQLSLDAGGPLSPRGWALHRVEAPLRESIAAALLELLNIDPALPLIDPCCGSGTIILEAATRTLGTLPRQLVDAPFYPLQEWNNFDPALFEETRHRLEPQGTRTLPAALHGRDINPEAIDAARHNTTTAGLGDHPGLTFTPAPLSEPLPPELAEAPFWIVTNPPYGARMDNQGVLPDLLSLADTPHARLAFLWARDGRDAVTRAAPHLTLVASFKNGGLPVDFWASPH